MCSPEPTVNRNFDSSRLTSTFVAELPARREEFIEQGRPVCMCTRT